VITNGILFDFAGYAAAPRASAGGGVVMARGGGRASPSRSNGRAATSAASMNIWDVERPVGLDGKPIALGGTLAEATHKSEARMNAHLAQWEASNLEQTDKLTQKLRKEHDELRMANKQRQRAMTQVRQRAVLIAAVYMQLRVKVASTWSLCDRATLSRSTSCCPSGPCCSSNYCGI
jgi:hypothetical protein